jgi:hypothetical protein
MDMELEIPCPECGTKIKTSIGAVAAQKTVKCRRGHAVKLVDQGHGARGAKKSLDDLDKALDKLTKKFK